MTTQQTLDQASEIRDSLFDVFPFAVTNVWTYDYHYENHDIQSGYHDYDTGQIELTIVGQTSKQDTAIWHLEEHRAYQHSHYYGGSLISTSFKDTIVNREIYELQIARHQFFIKGRSFIFTPNLPTTLQFERFQTVDSSGYAINIFSQYHEYAQFNFYPALGLTDGSEYSSDISGSWSKWFHLTGVKLLPVKENQNILPSEFTLEQNFPNPFNPATVIRYSLPVGRRGSSPYNVILKIYNSLGEEVATLVDEVQEAGYKSVTWDASHLASGVYVYKLTVGNDVLSKKMVLVK